MPISGYRTSPKSFKAETLDERIRIPLDYTKQVREIQKDFNELGDSAESLNDYLKNNPESEEAKTYQAYMDMLNQGVDDFMRSGNLQQGYNSFLNAKRKFTKEISPIAVAIKARQEAIVEDDKLRKTDRTLFGASPRNTSIHDWMNGNIPELQTWSGNTLYNYAKDMATGVSKRYYDDPEIQKLTTGILDIISRHGIDAAPLGILDLYNKQAYPELNQIINSLLSSNGFDPSKLTGDDAPDELIQAVNYISQGITAGLIYEESHNPTHDPTYTRPTQTTPKTPTEPKTSGTQVIPYRVINTVTMDSEAARQANIKSKTIDTVFNEKQFKALPEDQQTKLKQTIETYLTIINDPSIPTTIEEIQQLPKHKQEPIINAIKATFINGQYTSPQYVLNMKSYDGFTNAITKTLTLPNIKQDGNLNSFAEVKSNGKLGKSKTFEDISENADHFGLNFNENGMYLTVQYNEKEKKETKTYTINPALVPKMSEGNVANEYRAYQEAVNKARDYANNHPTLFSANPNKKEQEEMYKLNYEVAVLGDALMRMIYEAAIDSAPDRPSSSSTIINVGMSPGGEDYYE